MSTLTKEHLDELSERIQERLAEFACDAPVMRPPSPGMVRLIVDVIEEWRKERHPTPDVIHVLHRQRWMAEHLVESEPEAWQNDDLRLEEQTSDAHPAESSEPTPAAEATSQPVMAESPPEQPPTSPAPEPVKQTPRRGRKPSQPAEQLKADAYAFIRSIAKNGIMPGAAEYDQAKPDSLMASRSLIRNLGLKWSEMAADLGLTLLTPVEHMNHLKAERKKNAVAASPNGATAPATNNGATPPQPSIPPLPEVQVVPARVVMAETPQIASNGEHTAKTPDPAAEDFRPRPAPPNHVAEMAAMRRKLRGEAIALLRDIAVDRVMPSIDEYNTKRPADLPAAIDLMNRLGYTSWHDVALDAGLVHKGAAYGQKPLQGKRKKVRR